MGCRDRQMWSVPRTLQARELLPYSSNKEALWVDTEYSKCPSLFWSHVALLCDSLEAHVPGFLALRILGQHALLHLKALPLVEACTGQAGLMGLGQGLASSEGARPEKAVSAWRLAPVVRTPLRPQKGYSTGHRAPGYVSQPSELSLWPSGLVASSFQIW